MPLTNSTSTSFVQLLPNQGATGLFALAQDGDLQALTKVCAGEGGPDFVFTGDLSAAETVNFTVPFASLLKLYPTQVSGQTFLVIKAKVFLNAAAVANCYYSESVQAFKDVGGAMTILVGGTVTAFVQPVTSPPTAPALTNSGSNTLQIAVSGLAAVAKNARVELYVTHVV